MHMQLLILVVISVAEMLLFVLILRFFSRLRKSENLLLELSEGQQNLMDKLRTNAELERELMQSFATRQAGMQALSAGIDERVAELSALLEQAQAVSRSPHFLRELILSGKKKGRTSTQLARATGLSLDEVELILAQAEK